jgi:D-alanine-D-alanine ligase
MTIAKDKRIGVLLGGLSAERKVSLKSGAAVAGALRRRGWDVVEIDVGRDLPAKLVESRVDVAWLALHGKFGEDGCVQGLCEVMGVPYTGSGVRTSAMCMDKTATKRAVAGVVGVVMAKDHVWRKGDPVPEDLGWPVMVKPPSTGSTIGMTKAANRAELEAGLAEAVKYGDEVLLEEFVEGDEITVAVVDGRALPVVRILPESGWFDFEAKYTKGKTVYEVPAKISQAAWDAAQAAAVAAYRAMGCRGLSRADFIVRADQVPVFLELNTLPGMTETSLSPMAAGQVGISFEDLVETILHGATCAAPEV